ncbi:MAG: hypothetical protein K0S65_3769, partial [Labilithrix sp.]|nr:hypothetical protein [Labilithrix sp.]
MLALLLGGCSLAALDGYSNGVPNGQDAGEP